jgi:hypothetical protein
LKIPFINIVVFSLVSRLSGGFSEIFLDYFLASEMAGERLQVTSVVEIDLSANIREIGQYRRSAMIAGQSKSLKRN